MAREFEIGTMKFKLNKINAMKQFHIVRRIAPILAEFLPVAQKLSKLNDEELKNNMEALAPIVKGFSSLPEADSEKVLLSLLESVELQQSSGNWAFVAVSGNIMFANLTLPQLMQIAGKAFMFNLSDFFDALPRTS